MGKQMTNEREKSQGNRERNTRCGRSGTEPHKRLMQNTFPKRFISVFLNAVFRRIPTVTTVDQPTTNSAYFTSL